MGMANQNLVDIEAPFVVRRAGEAEWHLPKTVDGSNWSQDKVTLCGRNWEGWAIGPVSGEPTVCRECGVVVSREMGRRRAIEATAFEAHEVREETRSVSGRFVTHEGVELAIGVTAERKILDGVESPWPAPVLHLNTYTARLGEADVVSMLELARELFALYRLRHEPDGEG
jgi:hypothetical protein